MQYAKLITLYTVRTFLTRKGVFHFHTDEEEILFKKTQFIICVILNIPLMTFIIITKKKQNLCKNRILLKYIICI